jgi:regulator of nonsense transcripts 1
VIETPNGKVSGRAIQVRGKTAKISVSKKVDGGAIRSITTVGKEDLTCAEKQRSLIVLDAFQGSAYLLSSPFVQSIFFPPLPANKLKWPEPFLGPTPTIDFPYRPLDDSQRKAVDFCLSMKKESRIGLIVGPPGTGDPHFYLLLKVSFDRRLGKTTVIAAAVTSIINGTEHGTVWIVAQSNVAVKNVAEKLVDSSFFNFSLLVSNEFHFEWQVL